MWTPIRWPARCSARTPGSPACRFASSQGDRKAGALRRDRRSRREVPVAGSGCPSCGRCAPARLRSRRRGPSGPRTTKHSGVRLLHAWTSTPPTCRPDARRELVKSLRYQPGRSRRPEHGRFGGRLECGAVAFYLALPPAVFPTAVDGAWRRRACRVAAGSWSRSHLARISRARSRSTGCSSGSSGRPARRDLPGRPRAGARDSPEPPGAASRQPDSRARVEQRAHRAGRPAVGGDARPRGPRGLLRLGGGPEGRRPEPSAAGPLPDRDGAAGELGRRARARPEGRSAARDSPAGSRRHGVAHPPGPLHRRRGRRARDSLLRRRGGRRPAARHRDLRGGRARATRPSAGRARPSSCAEGRR